MKWCVLVGVGRYPHSLVMGALKKEIKVKNLIPAVGRIHSGKALCTQLRSGKFSWVTDTGRGKDILLA